MALLAKPKRKPKKKVKKVDGSVSTMTAKGIVSNKNAMKNLSSKQLNARLKQALKNEKAYNTQSLRKSNARIAAGTVLGSQGIASSNARAANNDLINAGAQPTTRNTGEDNSTNYEGRWFVE